MTRPPISVAHTRPGRLPVLRPSHRPPRRRTRAERVTPVLLGLVGVATLPALAAVVDRDAMGGLGLAGVLPPWAWVGIGAAILACVLELLAPDPRTRVLVPLTVLLVLSTTGLPSVVEQGARFSVSWTHLGFVEAIAGANGQVPVGVDARFSWAGFFSQWAWLVDASGGLPMDAVLRWAPPVIVVLWATGVHALAHRLLGGRRAPWAATWLFLGLNWIEQDYFSPQATALLLALTVLVLATGPLSTRRAPLTDPTAGARRRLTAMLRWRTWWPLSRLRAPHPDAPMSQVLLALAIATLAIAATACAHQLTPFAIAGQLAVLAIAGRVWGGRGLVVLLILCVLGWVVLGGREFWVNQLALATGDVGDASGSVASALGDRLVGDLGQLVVKVLRVVLALATFGIAALGAWIRWRRTGEVVWLVAALAPAGLVLVQSYGGEVLLRVLLYGLPFFAILGVEVLRTLALRSQTRRRRWRSPLRPATVVLGTGAVLLFVSLVIVRGGNDSYIALRPEEIALTRAVLDAAPTGSTVLPLNDQAPVQVTRVGQVTQDPKTCTALADDPVRCALADLPDAIWVLPTMDAEGVALDGLRPGWSRKAVTDIANTGRYRIVYRNGLYAILARIN